MLSNVSSLTGRVIQAADGSIGHVRDLYFDDLTWSVRHLVVDTGTWLPGRQVLISPAAVVSPVDILADLRVQLSREQVRSSPDISTQLPISRQKEMEYFAHYGWAYYGTLPMEPMFIPMTTTLDADELAVPPEHAPPHLRSSREVMGYRIHASDGLLGHVEDFLVDDERWSIRYFVVDTRNWWPGKRVVLSPGWVESIQWDTQEVRVTLDRDAIRGAPEYDPAQPVNRAFEDRLYAYYGQPKYWT